MITRSMERKLETHGKELVRESPVCRGKRPLLPKTTGDSPGDFDAERFTKRPDDDQARRSGPRGKKGGREPGGCDWCRPNGTAHPAS